MGNAKLIADYFGVSVDYLMGNEGTARDEGQSAAYYINDETRRIAKQLHDNPELSVMFDAYSDLDPKDAQLIMDMIRRMTNDNGAGT